jgi:hypothetical protein
LHSSKSQEFLPWLLQDYLHVRQKIQDWKISRQDDGDEQQRHDAVEVDPSWEYELEKPGISPEELEQRKKVEQDPENLTDLLCTSLAIANAKRRQQFRYWEYHPFSSTEAQQPEKSKTMGASGIEGPKTVLSFSTVPHSAKFPSSASLMATLEKGASRTVYGPSVVGGKQIATIRIPDVPKRPAPQKDTDSQKALTSQETFDCPYCSMSLNVKEMESRLYWK